MKKLELHINDINETGPTFKTDLKLPDYYESSANPNIISQVLFDLKSGKPYHYIFTGRVGLGKTFLADIIAWSYPWNNRHFGPEGKILVKDLYRGYLTSINSDYRMLRSVERHLVKDFLIIDDLGNEAPSTPTAHEYIGTTIERRYNAIKHTKRFMATIITTNLTQKEIRDTYGSRVEDRLLEMFTIMKFTGKSFRKKQSKPVIEG